MPLHTLPAFNDNYIWLLETDQKQAWVVDPGDPTVVEHALEAQGLTLAGLFITHHHADHTGGIASLCQGRNIPVYGPRENIAGITHWLDGGEVLELLPIGKIQVLPVPGHTARHIAYYVESEGLLFCGDTLFSSGCGRLFEGTAREMYHSLETLKALPPETRVCCAHEYTLSNLRFALTVEPENAAIRSRMETVTRLRETRQASVPSLLGDERKWNPFLRCDEPSVIQAASLHSGHPQGSGEDTFAVLRSWKDSFRG